MNSAYSPIDLNTKFIIFKGTCILLSHRPTSPLEKKAPDSISKHAIVELKEMS